MLTEAVKGPPLFKDNSISALADDTAILEGKPVRLLPETLNVPGADGVPSGVTRLLTDPDTVRAGADEVDGVTEAHVKPTLIASTSNCTEAPLFPCLNATALTAEGVVDSVVVAALAGSVSSREPDCLTHRLTGSAEAAVPSL